MSTNRLRVAIVTATYPPYTGGTGNVCQQHARQLRELGHAVTVFTAGAGLSGDDGVVRLRSILRLGNGVLLPQLLWRLRGFDIIHWHYPFFGGEFVALAAKLTRTPLVVTYHQDVILGGWLGRVARIMERTVTLWALRSADLVLFTSNDYAQYSKMRRYLSDAQVGSLSNGVDLARFSADATHTHNARFTALLVAGLDAAHYFKGVANFLQAVAQLDDVNAIIVGDGDLRGQYEREARRLELGERVTFAGRVSDGALPGFYRSADVAVLPSTTMGEAFGLVLVESLASGTPVIASDLPGVRTVVADGVDGLLVAPADVAALAHALAKMARLSADDRRKMGKAGRAKVEERYGWEAIGGELAAVYKNVVQDEAFASLR